MPAIPCGSCRSGARSRRRATTIFWRRSRCCREGLAWRFTHIGGGPLLSELQRRAAELGIAARIDWRGAQAQAAVLAAYREADIFALASRISADGDRDGLPNVLLEAQSQRIATVATALPGIAELIEPEVTGLLVPAGDPSALAAALERLIRHPQERARLGAAGEACVRTRFTLEAGIERLAAKFGLAKSRRAMRIAFYAPLKPPDHPVPSGDRRMARLLIAALAAADTP